jgi:hypothetical protein
LETTEWFVYFFAAHNAQPKNNMLHNQKINIVAITGEGLKETYYDQS